MAGADTPSKPLGVISSNDQSGLISIITALSFCFVLVSFGIRLYMKTPSKGLWKPDDNVLTAAAVVSCLQTALVFYEVHIGLGKVSVMEDDETELLYYLQKYHFANNYLYIITLLFSKASIGFLYLRLTRTRSHIHVTWIIQGICASWAVLSIMLINIGVSWQDAFTFPYWRWLTVGITDCVTETLLVLMSVYLVIDLRMNIVQKGTVVFAFAMRLLTIPAIAIRLHYLNPSTLTSNPTFALSLSITATQIELGYSIMAASITVLKPFMVVYEKPTTTTSYYVYSNKNHTGKDSFKLESTVSKRSVGRAEGVLSPNQSYSAAISHNNGNNNSSSSSSRDVKKKKITPGGHGRSASIHSHDSRKMIIERKRDWSVRYEEADEEISSGGDGERDSRSGSGRGEGL